jgi:glycogen debranching enzyme
MEETLLVEEPYYIQAPAAPADERTRVLKHGETFAIFDRFGDIRPGGLGEQGLYHAGTRFLSRMSLLINGSRPLLLSSSVREDNVLLSVDLTNPDEKHNGDIVLPHGSLHVHRERFLWEGVCYEQLRIRNFHPQSARLQLSLMFAADYADIFEVRVRPGPDGDSP